MKKVKTLVKKILGRPARSLVTIDTVAQTSDGFCVIGWYFTPAVSSVAIVDDQGKEVSGKLSPIPRDDIKAATGESGKGFQLMCKTARPLDELALVATLSDGKQQQSRLFLKGQETDVAQGSGDIASNIITSGDTKGCCEYAITSPNYVYVCGWLTDSRQAENWTLVDGRGFSVAESVEIMRFHRRDVADTYGDGESYKHTGFSILLKLDSRVGKQRGLTLCAELQGNNIKLPVEQMFNGPDDPMTNAKRLLNGWHSQSPSQLSKADLFGPMLREIYPRENTASVTRHDFREQPSTPRATILIPLYGRYDFLRFQLSYFGIRSQYRDVEVLYIIDDPKIAANTLDLAKQMAQVSEQPFSVLQLSNNVGFGTANNIGAKHAASDMLLLLNSDVLPKTEDWLDKMLASASRAEVGIVGARLLFEDNTLQHDGMAPMLLPEYPGLIFNDHPRKGWLKALSPHRAEEAECAMTTAACWAVKKADFIDAGGFDTSYVLGDFEDSDLCLTLLSKGKINLIRRDAELYHLERQSQNLVSPGRWKHNITILNAALFTGRWRETLESMLKDSEK